jgi:hypothetical protein
VTVAFGEIVLYIGWVAGCAFSLGFYCGPFTMNWKGLAETFALPAATVLVGFVLRRVD